LCGTDRIHNLHSSWTKVVCGCMSGANKTKKWVSLLEDQSMVHSQLEILCQSSSSHAHTPHSVQLSLYFVHGQGFWLCCSGRWL